MGWQDWAGFENLKAISKHTVQCTAAILSFIWISWLVRRGLGQGLLTDYIEYTERFVLAVMFLVFLVHIGYDLWRELKRNVKSSQIVFA